MVIEQKNYDALVTGFKPTLCELEIIGRNIQDFEASVSQEVPDEALDLGALKVQRIIIGVVPGVNDPSALLVNGANLTVRELGKLAIHYINHSFEIDMLWREYGVSGSYEYRMSIFAGKRLDTIRIFLGEHLYDELTADVNDACNKKITALNEREKNLPACKKCGGKRTLPDDEYNDGLILCVNCLPEEGKSDE